MFLRKHSSLVKNWNCIEISRFVVTAISYFAVVVVLKRSYHHLLDIKLKERVINQKIEKLQKGIRFFEEYLSLKIKRGGDG